MRLLRASLLSVAALLLAIAAVLSWALGTQSGARWIATRAENALGEKLSVGEVSGTVAGPLTVAAVRYRDPDSGKDVRIGLYGDRKSVV